MTSFFVRLHKRFTRGLDDYLFGDPYPVFRPSAIEVSRAVDAFLADIPGILVRTEAPPGVPLRRVDRMNGETV